MKRFFLLLSCLINVAFSDNATSELLCKTTLLKGDYIFFALGNFNADSDFYPLHGFFHSIDNKTNINYPSCLLEISIQEENKDKGVLNLKIEGGVIGQERMGSWSIVSEGINLDFNAFPKKINYGRTIVESLNGEDNAYLLIYRSKSVEELKEAIKISNDVQWVWRDLAFFQRLEDFHRIHKQIK